jgi:hypothetical protein
MNNNDLTGAPAAGACALIAIVLIASLLIGPFILMVLWNLVVPSVFGGPVIDFPQAFGLSLLLSIVGGAFRRS